MRHFVSGKPKRPQGKPVGFSGLGNTIGGAQRNVSISLPFSRPDFTAVSAKG